MTDKQALKIAEASLVKYMDNGSSNVVMYECEVDDESGKAIKDVSVGYADYDRSTTAQLKEDKKSVKIQDTFSTALKMENTLIMIRKQEKKLTENGIWQRQL